MNEGNWSVKDVGKVERNDSVVQTRCKRTTLAILAFWYEEQGERARNLSELVRMSLEGLAEVLVNNGARKFEDTSQAAQVMEELGFGGLNPQKRGGKNLWNNLVHEDRKRDKLANELDQIVRRTMKNNPQLGVTDLTKFVKKEVEGIEEMRRNLGIIPENVKPEGDDS